MEEPKHSRSRLWEVLETCFWIAYILVPIFTGILAYQYLPNESPILADNQVLKPYKILASHDLCNDNGSCSTVADVWENTTTGQIFTQAGFKNHRISQRDNMTVRWFAYGLIGCFAYATIRYMKKKNTEDFYRHFGVAVLINLAVAVFIFVTQKTTY